MQQLLAIQEPLASQKQRAIAIFAPLKMAPSFVCHFFVFYDCLPQLFRHRHRHRYWWPSTMLRCCGCKTLPSCSYHCFVWILHIVYLRRRPTKSQLPQASGNGVNVATAQQQL